MTNPACECDATTVSSGSLSHSRETKTGSFGFSCETGLKYFAANAERNPASSVSHFNDCFFIPTNCAQAHQNSTVSVDRLNRIQDEIQNCILNAGRIQAHDNGFCGFIDEL